MEALTIDSFTSVVSLLGETTANHHNEDTKYDAAHICSDFYDETGPNAYFLYLLQQWQNCGSDKDYKFQFSKARINIEGNWG